MQVRERVWAFFEDNGKSYDDPAFLADLQSLEAPALSADWLCETGKVYGIIF